MFCTLIVITFRPRFSKVPEKYLQPSDAPILFSIIEDLRINLNSSPIDYIVLSTELNASMGYAGWNGKKVLTLGYPLFLILNAQETVEVISHELAHNVNKDPMRGYFQWYASISLQRWYEITYPLQIVSTGGGIFTLLFSVPYNLCLWMVSQVFKWLMILFNWLMWRDSQRAEYYADYLAMTMSGNSCFESIFQKLGYHNELSLAVQKAVLHKLEDRVFQFFLESVGNLPDYEVKRIRQVNMLYESRVDSTHPPTPYRIGFASSRGVIPPGYNLTDYKHRQLLEELQKFETSVIQILCDEYKAVLYQIYD
ncbi:MAG: M48 family metallopeptidase [Candidatus Kapabacteria bacterium]|nr:M48 family metallopeptidase [Candidatus Kapabacteria bacterium]